MTEGLGSFFSESKHRKDKQTSSKRHLASPIGVKREEEEAEVGRKLSKLSREAYVSI